jgi:hypothetical protein
MSQGNLDEARGHLEESLAMCRRLGYRWDMLVAQIHFRELERASGDVDRARSLLDEARPSPAKSAPNT